MPIAGTSIIEPHPDSPPSQQRIFGGAPGFVVSKQEKIAHTISWHEMQQLAEQSAIWQQCDVAATELVATNLNLATLRAHLPLTLPDLLTFKKKLETLGEDKTAK